MQSTTSAASVSINTAPIFGSCINCESRMKYFGAWRPILKNMLLYTKKKTGQRSGDIIKKIVKDNFDKIDLFIDLFGLINSSSEDTARKNYHTYILNGKNPVKQV